jgi:integrase
MKIKRARQITTKLALEFAFRAERSVSTQAGYLSAIRGFAQYLSGIEPKTEVPPSGLIRRGQRPQPYIYSDEEIIRILNAAREHPSTARYALKPHTLYCLFGLLSVTGMRLTEALSLRFECSARRRYSLVDPLFCRGRATGCYDPLYPEVALASSLLAL